MPVKDKASEAAGQDPFAIGVAKSKSPLGPWKDAIGKPLLTTSQTQIETIDPAFFVDEDGTGYLHFGTFGHSARHQDEEGRHNRPHLIHRGGNQG